MPSREQSPGDAGPVPGAAPDVHEVLGALRKDQLRAALFDEPVKERRIGRYRVVGFLGRGGMGTVLEASDDALERRVALKLLHRDVSPRDRGRLLREARALARLSHPNVVQVHEVVEHPEPFIAMEFVPGRTLSKWQRDRPPWRACVRAYLQAGYGLVAAHEQKLVHRDFKPSNCIIDDEGRVRVMDFGLVRTLDPPAPGQPSTDEDEESDSESVGSRFGRLTETGVVVGTLAYMAPEQLGGRDVDARSDQFAFCVSLHEALYGRRPFAGRTAAALHDATKRAEIRPSARGARVPLALRRALLRGLAFDPDQRWSSMGELLGTLERLVRPRWRGRLALVALVGGVGLSATTVWYEASSRQACVGVDEQLEGIWDDARREGLRAAVLGSMLPYAEETWAGIEPRLDTYADGWTRARRDACEASQIRRDEPESLTDRRLACLHERKVALREAVEVLVGGEADAVERAVALVSRLPELDRCHDVPVLLAEVPPPVDPEDRATVQDLRETLAKARALRWAGRYATSLEVADRAVEVASGLGYRPLLAEVELARGWALYGEGRHDDAVLAFEDAYWWATSEGHDAVAADAATMLSYIVGALQSKRELAVKWGLTARAHARRPAAEPGAEAMALANIAVVHQETGELELARSTYEEALALQERIFGPDDVRLAFTLNGLGVTLLALDQADAALVQHRRALALRREALGAHHPHVAMSLNNIGVVLVRQGHTGDAVLHFREALELKEAILGPEHAELASSLANLGGIAHVAGDDAEARRLLERALAITERSYGPDSLKLGPALRSLGLVLTDLRRFDEAHAMFVRVLELDERGRGPEHPELVSTLVSLSGLELDRGDVGAAGAYSDRAMRIVDGEGTVPEFTRALALDARARVLLEEGDARAALELAQQALAVHERVVQSPLDLAGGRLLVARAHARLGAEGRSQARTITTEVIEALASLSGPGVEQLREQAREHLARLRDLDPRR